MAQQGVHSVSDKTFLHREKHFGWRGVTRLEDTTGVGPHNSAKRANVSHSSGLLTSSLQCVYTVSQGVGGVSTRYSRFDWVAGSRSDCSRVSR